ncbi:MAG: 50S ribosomal protein L25 [Fibrobacterales bacterium]
MNTVELNAEKREQGAKSINKAMRKEGNIPAVVYGNKEESFSVVVAEKEFRKVYFKGQRNKLVELKVGGDSKTVIVYAVQRDTFQQTVTHIDFKIINENEPVNVQVSLKLEGVPYGVKTEGGKLFQPTKVVTIACDPKQEMPESVTINIDEYKAGHTYYVRDIDFGNATLASSDKAVLFSISTKGGKKEGEEETTEAAEATAG